MNDAIFVINLLYNKEKVVLLQSETNYMILWQQENG